MPARKRPIDAGCRAALALDLPSLRRGALRRPYRIRHGFPTLRVVAHPAASLKRHARKRPIHAGYRAALALDLLGLRRSELWRPGRDTWWRAHPYAPVRRHQALAAVKALGNKNAGQ